MPYSERDLGYGYCVEHLDHGWVRVVGESARDDLLRGHDAGGAKPGDRGRIFYYGDGKSYGQSKFMVDNTLEFDPQPLLDVYNAKFHSNHSVI